MKQFNALAWVLVSSLILNGCVVGYYQYPKNQLTTPYAEKSLEKATYFVKGMTTAGGNVAVEQTLKMHSPFKRMDAVEQINQADNSEIIPATGVHIHAKVETISPSSVAIVFGYISLTTLTILPAWSTKDGVRVTFNIYKDKAPVKTMTYEARRAGGVWLVLLPFIWANLTTTSEEKACETLTKQFLEDAKPILMSVAQ